MESESDNPECSTCAHKPEDYRCTKCGMTGYEIYIKRWEYQHNEKHPSNWQ